MLLLGCSEGREDEEEGEETIDEEVAVVVEFSEPVPMSMVQACYADGGRLWMSSAHSVSGEHSKS